MQLKKHVCTQGNQNELSHPSPVSLQTMYCQASRSYRILDMLQCCTSSADGMAAAPLLCMPQADPAVLLGTCTAWCSCPPRHLLHCTAGSCRCTGLFSQISLFSQSS